MISFTATNNKVLLNKLYNAVFGSDIPGDVGYVLVVDGIPCGVAKLSVTESVSHIHTVGILPKLRGKGYGDFFTRSLMNVLIDVTDEIVIDYPASYFLQFGFRRDGDEMRIASEDLVFPKKCQCGDKPH